MHKAKALREWLEQHADRIEVLYLPPYSPDLKRTMLSQSRRIQRSPDRVRAYFKHRNIKYAA